MFYFSKDTWCPVVWYMGFLSDREYRLLSGNILGKCACWCVWVSSSVRPTVCGEALFQGHLLINDWGRISVSVSPLLPPSLPPSWRPPILGLHKENDPYPPHTFAQNLIGTHSVTRIHTHTRCAVSPDLPRAVQGQISCDTVLPCHLWPSRKF